MIINWPLIDVASTFINLFYLKKIIKIILTTAYNKIKIATVKF